jgi:hypothetical protein
MATAPRATPASPRSSGPGCLVLVVAFPLVILVGIVIGTVLNRPDDPPEEKSVTIAEGTTADGTEWRVDAVRDVEGDVCTFLYEDGAQLTGGCELSPDDATFGDETVVFGKAEPGTETVEVILDIGERVEIDTVEAEGIEGRFYAEVVPGDVDVERLG